MSVIIKNKHFFDCQHCQHSQPVDITSPFNNLTVYICKHCNHGNYRDNIKPFFIYKKKIILDGKERKFIKETIE